MPYLGNEPATAYTSTTKDSFSGDASTTDFTMSKSANVNAVRVVVENVVQDPGVAYTCSGTTLSFTSAPPTGTNNIYVVHLGPPAATVAPPSTINNPTTFTGGVSLKNETPEDTDGGRESIVTFQGTQSGSEISTLAQIQASHDGTSDDQKADLIFRTNDGSDGTSPTTAMIIDSAQNVGINATPKETHADADVVQIGGTGYLANWEDQETYLAENMYIDTSGAYKYLTTSHATLYSQTTGTHQFKIASSGTADASISFIEPARIDSAGITIDSARIGSRFLSLNTSSSGDGHILLKRDGTNKYQISSDPSHNFFIYNYNNNAFALKFNTSGNLQVQGVYNDTGSDSPNVVVDGSGNIYRSTSALKYKKDVRDIESIDIDRFRPVRYKSAITKDDDTKDCLGFISDEVHDDGLTELVTYGVNPETEKTEVEGFRYDRMTVILTKVVQEQKATIEAQATQIADLIKRVEALEAG
jgi:hypothetical protein